MRGGDTIVSQCDFPIRKLLRYDTLGTLGLPFKRIDYLTANLCRFTTSMAHDMFTDVLLGRSAVVVARLTQSSITVLEPETYCTYSEMWRMQGKCSTVIPWKPDFPVAVREDVKLESSLFAC